MACIPSADIYFFSIVKKGMDQMDSENGSFSVHSYNEYYLSIPTQVAEVLMKHTVSDGGF